VSKPLDGSKSSYEKVRRSSSKVLHRTSQYLPDFKVLEGIASDTVGCREVRLLNRLLVRWGERDCDQGVALVQKVKATARYPQDFLYTCRSWPTPCMSNATEAEPEKQEVPYEYAILPEMLQ
jgi:hypothetical protein